MRTGDNNDPTLGARQGHHRVSNFPGLLSTKIVAASEEPTAHWGLAELQFGLFEAVVEEDLWEPTFIITRTVEVSPFARASDADLQDHRAIRAVHHRPRGRQWLLRAQRRPEPGRALSRPGGY
jgi:hypothetical protein